MIYPFNEFVRDLKLGREVEFTYNNIGYFISYDNRGSTLFKEDDKTIQIFKDFDELLTNARIDSKPLIQVWGEVRSVTVY